MTTPPRIFLVAHGIHDDGGMERACAELIRGAHREFRFTVVSIDLAPELRPLCEWIRVRVPRRPMPIRFTAFFLFAGLLLRRRNGAIVHTVGAIVPNRVDIAAVHFCHAGYRASGSRRLSSGTGLLRRLSFRAGQRLALAAERYSYRPGRVAAFAAVSHGVGAELRTHYPGIPVHYTPNGVDTDRYRTNPTLRRELREAEGADRRLVALFVGGDWEHKGLAIAIRALAVATRADADVHLWIVGKGHAEPFQQLADELQVGNRVRFFGARPDVERFYSGADVFILPTAYETFSLVAHEAAACGLPIIAPAVSGIAELIGDDEAGIVVPRTADGVAEAVVALSVDPKRRHRLGECGRRRASEFTWARAVASMAELYRSQLAHAI